MKKIICLLLICFSVMSLYSCGVRSINAANSVRNKMLFLIAGLDDAAENTDVLFTVGLEPEQRRIYVAQIPRDTYFGFGNAQNKINQYYASKRSLGYDEHASMISLVSALEDCFSCKFDGFLALKLSSFSEIVDSIGGVDILLTSELVLDFDDESPIRLVPGVNHIDGKTAERFVRYRKGYITQDLGRMDAQKMFLNALFWKISSGLTLPNVISLSTKLENSTVTNIKIREIVPILWKTLISGQEGKSDFVTLAGEAVLGENNISYYVLNKASNSHIIRKYMFSSGEFDKNHRFLDNNNAKFIDIYEDESINYKEYDNETIKDLSLKNNSGG